MNVTLPQNWAKTLSIFAVLLTCTVASFAQPIVAPPAPICAGSTTSLTVTSSAPNGFYYAWYKNANLTNLLGVGSTYTTTALTAVGPNTFYVAQVTGPIVNAATLRTAVVVTVKRNPAAPTIAATSTCYGQSAAVVATPAAGASVNWYAAPAGAAPLSMANTYNTPALTVPTTYYAKSILNGCVSPARAITVSINALPNAPASTSTAVCVGSPATLNATGANSLTEWTYTPVGGGAATTGMGVSFTTPVLAAGNNMVKVQNVSAKGCKSAAKIVYAVGRTIPVAPVVAAGAACKGGTATLTATNGNATTEWHVGSATGTMVGMGKSFTTDPLAADATYFAVNNNGGCEGAATAVTVTVTDAVAPTVTGVAICAGDKAVLTATGTGTISWFSDLNGGARLSGASTYNTPALAQTTSFYAQQTINGCNSLIKEVKVTVNPLPATPQFTTNPTVCGGQTVNLRLANGTMETQWFASIYDNNLSDTLHVGSSYTTDPMVGTTTYYVKNVSALGCKSEAASQVVNVNRAPLARAGADKTLKYGETYTMEASGGLLYAWSPAMYLDNPYAFNPTTSSTVPVGSTVYTVTVTDGNGCTDTDSALITVTADPVQAAFPNVITPNGDGQNDVLMLPFLGEKISAEYTLNIYARAGNVVFTTTNYSQDWDAKDLPDDTYWYVLTYKGDKKDYRGFITVRR